MHNKDKPVDFFEGGRVLIPFFSRKKRIVPQIRIAIYDSFTCAPRVINCQGGSLPSAIENYSQKIYQLSQERGGKLPYSVIKELVENLLHASFADVVITIFPDGNVIRFSDHGPGISDPERAFQPGFSSASKAEKAFIQGVGSGLPVVKEAMKTLGGTIEIEENIGTGAVVTISLGEEAAVIEDEGFTDEEEGKTSSDTEEYNAPDSAPSPIPPKLTERQRKVFLLITEEGEVGPSHAASALGLSLTTAFRELSALEELGLVKTTEGGKRCLTSMGMNTVPEYIK